MFNGHGCDILRRRKDTDGLGLGDEFSEYPDRSIMPRRGVGRMAADLEAAPAPPPRFVIHQGTDEAIIRDKFKIRI